MRQRLSERGRVRLHILLIALPVILFLILLLPPIGAVDLGTDAPNRVWVYQATTVLTKAALALILAYMLYNLRTYARFLISLAKSAGLLLRLAWNDFRKRFVASYLGSVWGFVMPLIQILIFWFVFQKGFRAVNIETAQGSCPYILWLIAGIVPWFFIADSLTGGVTVFLEYAFLVKKIVFKIELLPLVKVLSASFNHVFFILIALVAFLIGGYPLSWTVLQLPYYLLCLFAILFALTLLFSSLNVFSRDIAQIVNILVQIGFWFTPIGWVFDNTVTGGFWRIVFRLNPFFYIVSGYRDALVYQRWFWQSPAWTAYFWLLTTFILLGSIKTYNRLKPHFADLI